jgi:hypothetical protein
MTRALLLAALLVAGLGPVATPAAQARGPERVPVCHRPGSSHQQTLRLPESAVRAHLRHGDTRGECPPPPGASACPDARIFTDPPVRAVQIFQDTGPALLDIDIIEETNAEVFFPSFEPDTSDPIEVTAYKVNLAQPATFRLRVTRETESTSSALICTTTF